MNAKLLYLATVVALLTLSACAQTPPPADTGSVSGPPVVENNPPVPMDNPAGSTENPAAPMAIPSAPRDDLYLRADTNNDGRVSAEEWEAARRGAAAGASGPR